MDAFYPRGHQPSPAHRARQGQTQPQLRHDLEIRRARPKNERDRLNRTLSNVAIADGLLIATDISGRIHCLDAQTGRPHWIHHTEAMITGSPLIVDKRVYVGNDEGILFIFALAANKKIIDKIEMDVGWIRSSPIYANGVLFVAAGNTLYAIAGNEKKPTK